MSYLGNSPTDQSFVATVDYFNGDGVTVAFTLSRQVASVAQVQAVIENVPQNPSSAFTLMGNVITFTSAPPSGSANIYVYYTSPNTKVMAPSAGTVDTTALAAAAVTPVKMANYGAELGMRNRVINGSMIIDQRNAGSLSITSSTNSSAFIADRWRASWGPGAGVMSWQKVTDAPSGFSGSLKGTVTTASTPSSTDAYAIVQPIEGLNLIDLALGGSSASQFTVSFWVKASVTGLFSVAVRSTSGAQTCVKQYAINSANTWEYKTVVFPAPTSGSFSTDNSTALFVNFPMGAGSTYIATDGVWTNGALSQTSGSNNIIATNGATFQFTGVQLEKGKLATPFEYRPYGTELALCQRYYQAITVGCYQFATALNQSITINTPLQAIMRSAPTATEKTLLSNGNVSTTYPPGTVIIRADGCLLRAVSSGAGTVDYGGVWQFNSEL